MPSRLRDLRVDFNSFVDSPANKQAEIVFFKRDDSQDANKNDTADHGQEDLTMDEAMKALLASLPEKSRGAVEKALRAADESVAAEKAALEKRAVELEAKVAELAKKDEKPADVLKGLPEEVRKRLEDAEKRAADAEKIAKEERAARELSEITKRVEAEMPHVSGTPAEKAALLQRMKGALSAEDFAKIGEILRAASKSIEAGALFAEIGGSAPAGSATAKLEAIAEDMRKSDPKLSKAVAMSKAAKQHPELRREQLAEQRSH
jgi:dTMP kinase